MPCARLNPAETISGRRCAADKRWQDQRLARLSSSVAAFWGGQKAHRENALHFSCPDAAILHKCRFSAFAQYANQSWEPLRKKGV